MYWLINRTSLRLSRQKGPDVSIELPSLPAYLVFQPFQDIEGQQFVTFIGTQKVIGIDKQITGTPTTFLSKSKELPNYGRFRLYLWKPNGSALSIYLV
uniref:Uncharacterized protein n=1 Tax=Tetranychus urticae TaxID=32264 RepID=T1K4V6_TETUR